MVGYHAQARVGSVVIELVAWTMSDGITHAHYANRAATALTVVGVAAATYHPLMLGIAVGGLLGKLVDPDLDHHWTTQSEQRVRRYNWMIGRLWSLYWTPYDWLHTHRGISHTWPLGTLGRFVYLLWLPVALSFQYIEFVPCLCWWLLVFVGMSVQDAVHLWLDDEV
jgi:uncharacterized metal-binding protein